jgi:flavin reductase (DIM6/NTAB) family NADH-FMN oxidoreductase RutF
MHSTDPHKSLASALGRIPSGVFVLTAARDGVETGMLSSWVQQCSFQPPLISIVIQRGRPIADFLSNDAVFTLNILEAAQTDMIAHFGKGFTLKDDAFQDIDIQRAAPHGPILQEALGYLFGKVRDRLSTGDHDLFLAEVTAGCLLDEGQPMVHIRKNGLHY